MRKVLPIFFRVCKIIFVISVFGALGGLMYLTFWAPVEVKQQYFEFRHNIGARLGILQDQVSVAGTGSMYPTFPKGEGKTLEEQSDEVVSTPGMKPYPSGFKLLGISLFEYQIKRGDIVSFSNQKVEEITQKLHGKERGFIKRVIGLPGDRIEIKDGLVILNGEPLKEQYIANARSTFGSKSFIECQEMVIPDGKLFVMGDNRKGSSDSRHDLGLISYFDIDHVIPLESQIGVLDTNWRDTSKDLDQSSKIKINKEKFLDLLNQKRQENGVKKLKYQIKLEQSAKKRGEVIIKKNDFSFEATRSGYTMRRAMSDVGYSNIVYGEMPIQGYYEADELIDNFFEFVDTKKFLLSQDEEEFGISEVEGLINGCPTQVVVLHFAGYKPPNYSSEAAESYKKAMEDLERVIPSWESIRGNSRYDQVKVEELLSTMRSVRDIYQQVYKRMSANQWLTESEKKAIEDAKTMHGRVIELQNQLNQQGR